MELLANNPPQKILFRIFLKLPAKFPGEQDVLTIFSTAKGATITPLSKR
jgi:hypothetical protein